MRHWSRQRVPKLDAAVGALQRSSIALIAALCVGVCTWLPSAAAQTQVHRIGVLAAGVSTEQPTARWLEVFRRGLAAQGWVEGRTVHLEVRDGRSTSRFAAAATELVGLKVDVIYAIGAPAVRVAAAATRAIPIVGVDLTNDPVAAGYAESYSRPGGNVTGIFLDAPEFSGKWLELLKGIVPDLARAVVLWDPSPGEAHVRAIRAIAPSLGVQLQVIEVRRAEDIDRAAGAFRGRPQALIVLPSAMFYVESKRLVELSLRQRIPTTSMNPQFADIGGLVAYGPDDNAIVERVAVLVGRILTGAKAGDLPIERPGRFELVINLKAAKALGLAIPDAMLARADRVIR